MRSEAEKAAEEAIPEIIGETPRDDPMGMVVSYLDMWKRDRTLARKAFLKGAAWAAPQWIKCSERLPEEGKLVLCCFFVAKEPCFIFLRLQRSDSYDRPVFIQTDGDVFGACGIAYWCELPAAPEVEK